MTTDTVPPPGPPPIIDCAVCGKRISRYARKDPHFVGAGMGISLLDGSEKSLEYIKEQLGPYSIDRTEYLICEECFLRALGVPEPEAGPEKETENN